VAALPPFLATSRARRLLAVAVAIVVVRVALPFALEAGIAWGGERATGVPVSVSNIDLGLLRGRVVLDGLSVAGPGAASTPEGGIEPETALLRWDRLEANLEWLDLLRGRIRLSELTLAAPTARVGLDESGQPILPAPPEDPTQPEAEPAAPEAVEAGEVDEEGSGWPIAIDRLELTGLDVQLLDGKESPAVEAGFETLRLVDVRFDDAGLGLGAIGFEAPSLQVRRDFALAEPAPADEASLDEESPTGEPTAYHMKELRIERAEFVMLTEAGPLQMAIEFSASGVTSAPGERFPIDLHLEMEQGVLELGGQLAVASPAFEGTLRWRDLPLPPITLLARPDLADWVESHSASGELAIDFRAEADGEKPAGVTLSGVFRSDDLIFRDPDTDEFSFGWKRFEIPIDEVVVPLGEGAETKPIRVSLGAVRLEEPRAHLYQPTSALERLFPPGDDDGASPPAEPTDAGPAPIVSIASFEILNGDLGYRDRRLRPSYTGRVRDLDVSVRGVKLPAQTVERLSVTAQLPIRSKLSLSGSHGVRRSNLVFSLDRLALSPLNPYAIDAAGYRVDEGHASLETKGKRTGERWEVSNDLVLHQLGLSSTGTGKLDQMIGVPVDVAMALLRDLEGNISLPIPLAVDRGELRVGVGSTLRGALRAAVAGAVTSPLKMMGAAFSFGEGGGLAVEPLPMAPGSVELEEDAPARLATLADLLAARPQLAVRLHGGATPTDRDGIAEQILLERLAADVDWPKVEGGSFFARRRLRRALEGGEASGLEGDDADLLARYRTATPVPPERFVALAGRRAEAVTQRLVSQHALPSEHVRTAVETDSDQSGVRITFEAR